MKYFIKIFSGSFFRTLGKIFAFIIVGIIIAFFFNFINIGNVSALTYNSASFTFGTARGKWDTNVYETSSGYNSSLQHQIVFGSSSTLVPGTYVKSIIRFSTTADLNDKDTKNDTCSVSFKQVGTTTLNNKSAKTYDIEFIGVINQSKELYCNFPNFYTFPSSGVNKIVSYNNITFYDSSQKVSQDIKDAQNSINNNINDMKENIDNSINSDDEDVNSSKCGIVCKLKNIASGIVNLPSLIWEKLKGGFEAIANAFVWIFDQIKGIFIPEPECYTIPPNLFNVNDVYLVTSGISKIEDDWITLSYDNTNGTGTKYFNYYINKSNLLKTNTEYTIFFEVKEVSGSGTISPVTVYTSNDSQFSDTKAFVFSSLTNGKIIKISNATKDNFEKSTNMLRSYIQFAKGQSGSITFRISVIEGDYSTEDNFEYRSFSTEGEEVCTKTNFFGWFEKFGNIISGFFKNLLDGILGFFSSDDVDTNDSFFSSFEDIDHGGISGVIAAPLKAIDKVTKPCSSVSLDVLGAYVELPCGDTLFWNKPEVATFRITWNILLGGGIIYALMCKLFKVIEGLKNPDDSRIEVMKL